MQIRPIETPDAAQLMALNVALDTETAFMLMEPGERVITLEQQVARIEAILASSSEALWVAEDEARLVGFVAVILGGPRRARHTARSVIGVRRSHWRRGLGARLLNQAEQWARSVNVRRLELTVVTTNARAVALYEKCGFVSEGIRVAALRIGERYVDEFYMAKLL